MGASTSREGGVETECDQIRREIYALEGKRAEVSEKERELKEQYRRRLELALELELKDENWENLTLRLKLKKKLSKEERKLVRKRKLEELKRELDEHVSPLRRELEQMQENLFPKRQRLEDMCKARKIKSTRRLELPPELWEKILGNLDENDLFPLALSCRYFRQKQMELVARTRKRMRQSGPGSRKRRLTLRTNLRKMFENDEPASAEYLQFCSKEKVLRKERKRKRDSLEEIAWKRDWHISILAAFHGHLPLLQELLQSSENLPFCDLTTDDYSELAGHAARGGQLETLQWLTTQDDLYVNSLLFASASKGGSLEIMEFLWNLPVNAEYAIEMDDCFYNSECTQAAAMGGHLEVLKWLRSKGFPLDEETVTAAAKGGHLDVMQWAIDSGCPYEVNRYTRKALEKLESRRAVTGQRNLVSWMYSSGRSTMDALMRSMGSPRQA